MTTAAALLCTLPASGQDIPPLPQPVINALTPMDTVPSTSELNNVFTMPLEQLRSIALDTTLDIGIAFRAIRALPAYCPPEPEVCGTGTLAHDTLVDLLASNQLPPSTPQQLMRLRVTVEALGATRSGLDADVDKLIALFDQNDSRDLRVAIVRALRRMCSSRALALLSDRYGEQTSPQVTLEIYDALRELRQCN